MLASPHISPCLSAERSRRPQSHREPKLMETLSLICTDGIYRVYRNTVVRHIRHALRTEYPDDWMEKLTSPFKKEWSTIYENAQSVRDTGEVATPLNDAFDCLSVNHFYNLFERYFDLLFPDIMTKPPPILRATRSAILQKARTIKRLRDPLLGHPPESPISLADAFDLLNSASYVLEYIDNMAADEVERLRDGLLTSPDVTLPDASTLPSRESIVSAFVGRRAELDELHRWLTHPDLEDQYLWLLAGDGGKGKTAIAYEFATQIRSAPPPRLKLDAVIWASAKVRRFQSGKQIQLNEPGFSDLDSVLDRILRASTAPDHVLHLSLREKKQECLMYLTEYPALVVLDDVDTLDDNNTTVSFFIQNISSTNSRLLLTSRRIPGWFFGEAVTQVEGLTDNDGVAFINSRLSMYGLDPTLFTKKIIGRILSNCDGSPLFIEDVLRICRVGEKPSKALSLWKTYQGLAARRYALGREYDVLLPPAQKVLLACALFGGYVSLEEISFVTELSEDKCRDAIEELQGLFLVPKPHVVRDLPRFILNVNTQRLVEEVYGDSDSAKRMRTMVHALQGKTQGSYESRELLARFIRRADRYVAQGNNEAAQATLTTAIDRFPQYADLYGKLGWLFKSWRPIRYTDARNAFQTAARLKSTNAHMYWHWWVLETRAKEWTTAAEVAEQGLKIIPDAMHLSYAAGYARSRKAKDLQQSHFGRAEQEARKAERHLRAARDAVVMELFGPSEPTDIVISARSQRLISPLYRALVLNYERLVQIMYTQADSGSVTFFLGRLGEALEEWREREPDNAHRVTETERLIYHYPSMAGCVRSSHRQISSDVSVRDGG